MPIRMFTLQLVLLALCGIGAFRQEMVFFIALLMTVLLELFTGRKYRLFLFIEEILLILSFTLGFLTMWIYDRATLSLFYLIRAWLGPIIGYFIGKTMVRGKENNLVTIVMVIVMSTMLHGVLNLYKTGMLSVGVRYVKEFWTGSLLSATLQGTYFALASALAVYLIFFKPTKLKILGGGIAAIVVYNAMVTATRAPLYLLIIMLVVAYANKVITSGEKRAKFMKLAKLVAGLLAILLVFVVMYQSDMFGVRTVFESSMLGERLQRIDNEITMTRQELWVAGAKSLIHNPMGYDGHSYAHNLWLDWGKVGGVLPAILLVVYTCCTVATLMNRIKRQKITKETAHLLLFAYVACVICFSIEPIMDAVPFLFIKFCIINGAVAKM